MWEVVTNKAEAEAAGRESGYLGFTPRSYPCLVDFFVGPTSVRLAVVYMDDAIRLIRAADKALPQNPQNNFDVFCAQQKEHDKTTAANILAMLEVLVTARLTNSDDYFKRFNNKLAMVDQVHSEELSKIATPLERRTLRQLYPEPDEDGEGGR